ncbi:MAG: MFS transporter [Ignavibacteriaceae bacterium]
MIKDEEFNVEKNISSVNQLNIKKDSYLINNRFSWCRTFTSLQHPNYRLWFFGQIISLFGTWMQATAQGFLVFELTHSPAYLGYVGFAAGIPIWLFMFYGGVIADRFPRRTVIIYAQTLMMILAFILAALTFTHVVRAWHIIVLAFFLGLANAFDAPARQAFLLELVDRKTLVNAIALNSTMFNTARALGPAAAGVVYAIFGAAWCFMLNGLSFIGVIVALAKMDLVPQPKQIKKDSVFLELKKGFQYSMSQPMIRNLMFLVSIISLFGISFVTLIPAWAVRIIHGNAATNGIMQSARGLGALLAALFIASLGTSKYIYKLITIGILSLPVFLFTFALVYWLPFSLLMLVGNGIALILVFNLSNAIVQNIVPDSFRGRVMSIYSFTSFGFLPLGSLIIGFLAERFTEPGAVIICSVITLFFSVLILIKIRKIKL